MRLTNQTVVRQERFASMQGGKSSLEEVIYGKSMNNKGRIVLFVRTGLYFLRVSEQQQEVPEADAPARDKSPWLPTGRAACFAGEHAPVFASTPRCLIPESKPES